MSEVYAYHHGQKVAIGESVWDGRSPLVDGSAWQQRESTWAKHGHTAADLTHGRPKRTYRRCACGRNIFRATHATCVTCQQGGRRIRRAQA